MGSHIIAHRVNDLTKLRIALENGANGLEIDITRQGGRYWAWHAGAFDNNWRALDVFLPELFTALRSDADRRVSLLIFDLKYGSRQCINATQMNEVRQMVEDTVLNPINVPENAQRNRGLFAFYTMNRTVTDIVEPAIETRPLRRHEGLNYDALAYKRDHKSATPERATEWQAANRVSRFLYSTGITSTSHSRQAWDFARAAQRLQDRAGRYYQFGTYAWTFNRAGNAATWMRDANLDAIMGNMRRNFGNLPNDLAGHGLGERSLATRLDVPLFRTRRP